MNLNRIVLIVGLLLIGGTMIVVTGPFSPRFMAPSEPPPHDHASHDHSADAAPGAQGVARGDMQGDGPKTETSCDVAVQITEAAERQPGGALFEGPSPAHHDPQVAGNGQVKADMSAMPEMKGAHMDHRPRHGGAFFMAPNKINHLEGTYSSRCGFRLYLFNAFTKPIGVGRFKAFITIIPDDEDMPETIRFLIPNAEGTMLKAPPVAGLEGTLKIELHLLFPGTDEPELFSIRKTI